MHDPTMAPESQQTIEDSPPWAWINAVNDILSTGPFEESDLPAQVLPWLFISDLGGLCNKMKLMELGVTHVLTTNKMYSNEELEKLKKSLARVGVNHLAVSGEDYPGYDLIGNHWDECRAFLERTRNDKGKKVVVHCAAGQNRSGLIVAAALVVIERMLLLDAVNLLKEKRGIVLTNRSFQQQLCILAEREGLLGDKPEGYKNEERLSMVENTEDRWA